MNSRSLPSSHVDIFHLHNALPSFERHVQYAERRLYVDDELFLPFSFFIDLFLSGDVQWNKNHVFNLCLTIGYFWTTLLVMIVLYIFIYGRSR